jgi:hypothetical protein
LLLQGKLETKRYFLQTLFCTNERDEELRTPIKGILGFFVALVMAGQFRGNELTRFFLTTVIKSPPKNFLPFIMDD